MVKQITEKLYRDYVARLEHDIRLIHSDSVEALQLYEIWSTFNEATEQRRLVSRSPASIAAALYEDAAIRQLVMILVRLFDTPGKKDVLKEDRISFPVIRGILGVPGLSDVFVERARKSISAVLSAEPEHNAQAVRDRIDSFSARLDRLNDELPKREKLLRDFRDANLAHLLRPDDRKAKALHSHVTEMVPEVLLLTEDVDLIVNGSPSIRWPYGEASSSATQLWGAVAAAFPLSE